MGITSRIQHLSGHYIALALLAGAMPAPAASQDAAPASVTSSAVTSAAVTPPPVAATVVTQPAIRLEVLTPGSGPMPGEADVVLIGYEGRLADGTVFDANLRTPLPVSGVIAGFAQGLRMMQRGGRYRLHIPAELGYGATAAGPIPANSDLVFTVDMIDFSPADAARAMVGLPAIEIATLVAGSGGRPDGDDYVLFTFVGRLADGTVFDSGDGVLLQLGGLIDGVNSGLKQMQAGGSYRLSIPAALAYGDRTVGAIPPGSDLVFDIELIATRTRAEWIALLRTLPPR